MNIRYILFIVITSFHISSSGQAIDSLHFTQEQYNQLVNRLNNHQDNINLGHSFMAFGVIGLITNSIILRNRINEHNKNQPTDLNDINDWQNRTDVLISQNNILNILFGSLFFAGIVIPIKSKYLYKYENAVTINSISNMSYISSFDIKLNFKVGDSVKIKLKDDPNQYNGIIKEFNKTKISILFNSKVKVIPLSKLESINGRIFR